jgi:hypothetical protein
MSNLEHNHKCNICGCTYYACDDCDSKEYIVWRAICCSPLHYQIYHVVNDYNFNVITKEQAYDFLIGLKLTDNDIVVLRDSVKSVINSILHENREELSEQSTEIKPKKKPRKTTEE